jgi:hypothetical protein
VQRKIWELTNVSTSAKEKSKAERPHSSFGVSGRHRRLAPQTPHWIAERCLERNDITKAHITVRLSRPEPDPDCPHDRDWRCAFEIIGLGDDRVRFAHGIETMDTLLNTFRGIRAILERSGTPVRWTLMEGDNVGFPRYVEDAFGRGFEQRMQRLVLCEVENLCNEPHDCLADPGIRVAMLEAKHGKHQLAEPAKRKLADVLDLNKPALATNSLHRSRWIATRNLLCFEHENRKVIVRIGRPQVVPTSTVWRCPFEVRGLPETTKDFGYGVDSIHAIQMALDGIRCALVMSDIDLNWEGVRAADPGFPMVVPMGFGREFEQRINKMIADKIEERIRPIRERNERNDAQRKSKKKPR